VVNRLINKLCWDTEFFGVGIGTTLLADASEAGWTEVKSRMQRYGIQLLYVYNDNDQGKALQDDQNAFLHTSGARLMDRKVIFEKRLNQISFPSEIEVYPGTRTNEALYSLALQSGVYSRFRLDKKLPGGSFERMYHIWMDKSVNGDMADKVLIAKHNNNIAGMITIKHFEDESSIGLFAVDEKVRGKSLGRKLMEAAEHEAISSGRQTLSVATQLDNQPACAFYHKQGYIKRSITEIYHVWMDQ
jgi:dTDP-4-amino-4,6-dideoxy-D-galactose acyltransferase